MTLDQLQQRDRRIEALDALGRARTREQADELNRLTYARDLHWHRLGEQIARARARAAELEAYARQHRLVFEGMAA